MIKKFKGVLLCLLTILFVFALEACKEDTKELKGFTVSENNISVNVEESKKVKIKLNNNAEVADFNLTWTNKSMVSIDPGNGWNESGERYLTITGKALGESEITIEITSAGGKLFTETIKVEINIKELGNKIGKPIEDDILGYCYYKNIANGIKVCWRGKNNTGKTITMYKCRLYVFNSSGNLEAEEITGKYYADFTTTGPVKPGEELIIFGVVGYFKHCSKVLIGEITLHYEDGTSEIGLYGHYTTKYNSGIK